MITLEKQSIQICQIQQHHIDEVSALLARGFVEMNKFYQQFNMSLQEAQYIFRSKIVQNLRQKISFVVLENKVIKAALFHVDVVDYLQNPEFPHFVEFFHQSGKASQKLQNSLQLSSIMQRGVAAYGMYGVVDPQMKSKGLSMKLWWISFSLLRLFGYRQYIFRVSSQVSLKMMKKFGARVICEAQIENENCHHKLWMMRMDLNKNFPTYKMFKEMIKNNQTSKPKL